MRRLIASIFIIVLCVFGTNMPAAALLPIVITPGATTITNSLISQNLTVVTPVVAEIKCTVTALDDYIINTSNSNVKIPINNLLVNSDGTERPFTKNVPLTIIQGSYPLDVSLTKNITLLLRNMGPLPYGTYTTTLQFKTDTGIGILSGLLGEIITTNYTFQFTIDPVMDITSSLTTANINLTENNIFTPSSITNNVTDTQVNIVANRNWELYLNTNSIGTLKNNYYFQVISKTGNITEYESQRTKLESNQNYSLAQGTKTGTSTIPVVQVPTYIIVRYSYTNDESNFIPEGTYSNPVQYNITARSDSFASEY